MLLIDSVYIHESGGKVLLEYFVSELNKAGVRYMLLLDERIISKALPVITQNQYISIKAGEAERKNIYRKLPEGITSIFCFANVPPPVPIKKYPVIIFVQNALLLSGLMDRNLFPVISKIRFLLKKFYIRFLGKEYYWWVVQTQSMKEKLVNSIGISDTNVQVIPFFLNSNNNVPAGMHNRNKFLYVADGVPQKNHHTLFAAWRILLTKYHCTPELHLTIPERFGSLIKKVSELKKCGLNVINHGNCSSKQLDELYGECGYLVFPSLVESFGLPLLESAAAGCGILAADLPYVYDVIEPAGIFEPLNAEHMAAVIHEALFRTPQSKVVIINKIDQLIELVTPKYK